MDKPLPPELDPENYEDVDIDDDDNPEMTEEDFARGKPLREVFPDLYEKLVEEEKAERAKKRAG